MLLVPVLALAQSGLRPLAIDSSRPYVFIEFVKIGAREALTQGEGSLGVWLRLYRP